ncbi:hypothetical protein FR932_02550 [Moritella marina ATCC 15381]|uniref:Tetratricopeptide repeat protein n=1 Tax=Moritella marina ATCC 15381 TaxID=1202962 RepID=A0A5J6WHY5_MORMI|nr:hypothetical protein [Moritella marina]QFI36790.1 hypothetical protein FR932_02550 [Moritella marina ATCC 15381]
MKFLYLVLLITLPSQAAEDANIELLNNHITVEVTSHNTTNFDESKIWGILDNAGADAARTAGKGHPLSDKLNNEINYQINLSALTKALKTKNTPAAKTLLSSNPQWRSCQRIQWLWLSLQNEIATGYGPKAQQEYRYIQQNCPVHALSTTQKVMAWTSNSAWPNILTEYKKSTGYDAQSYAKLSYQVQLATLSNNPNNKNTVAKTVTLKKDSKGAELLAWQYLNEKNYTASLSWFNQASQWAGKNSQKLIEGKLLSLSGLERHQEFDQLQKQWIKKYPTLTQLAANPQADALTKTCQSQPTNCLMLLSEINELTPQQHILAGWQWYKLQRPLTAKRSFEHALKALSEDTDDYQQAKYGYSLALNKAGFKQYSQQLASKLTYQTHQVAASKQTMSEHVSAAFEKKNYQYVIDNAALYEKKFGPDVWLTEIKGWSYHNQKKSTKAIETFQSLANAYPYETKFKDALKVAKCARSKLSSSCN